MKNNWKPISELAKIRRGASPRPIGDPSYFGGDVGWVKISDVTSSSKFLNKTKLYLSKLGESRSLRVDKGDLVMSICGTIGKPIIVDMPACIHDGFVQLYDIKNADVEYLYYILQFSEKGLERKGQPGTQVNLNTTIVGDYLVYAPSLQQQQKIANILSTVDTVIEKTETSIAKYQAIKQGLMHDLFTRGIDVNTGLLRPTPQDAPELYKESELGLIPRDWKVDGILEKCDEIFLGLTTKVDYVPEGGVPLIRAKDVNSGFLKFDEVLQISKRQHKDLTKNRKAKKGDVLITKSGTLGISALVDSDIEFSIYESIIVLQSKKGELFSKFLLWLLREPTTLNRLLGQTVGSTIGHLNLINFRELLVVFPKYEEQKIISLKIDALDSKIQTEQQALAKYQQLKAGLMQDLLTGKVAVD